MPRSISAIAHVKKLCDDFLTEPYKLEVIDIYQQPRLVQQDQIVVVPTLVILEPPPICKLTGDLSDTSQLLRAFGLRPAPRT